MFEALNGPSYQKKVSVTTTVAVEIKYGSTPDADRKVITLQPLDCNIRIFFGDGITTPSAATVLSDGFLQYKTDKETYEASPTQPVYIVAASGSGDVIIVERG